MEVYYCAVMGCVVLCLIALPIVLHVLAALNALSLNGQTKASQLDGAV